MKLVRMKTQETIYTITTISILLSNMLLGLLNGKNSIGKSIRTVKN